MFAVWPVAIIAAGLIFNFLVLRYIYAHRALIENPARELSVTKVLLAQVEGFR